MCCRTKVSPLVPDVAAAQLAIGQFVQLNAISWKREIPEEQTSVTATLDDGSLLLSLSPAVSSMEGHHHKRIAASVMYELAARYAEKVNGVVEQISINVIGCMPEGKSQRTLAVYPHDHFSFDRLCTGFRSVFMGEES